MISLANDSIFIIRETIGDSQKSRWSDFVIMAELNKAAERALSIFKRNSLDIGHGIYSLDIEPGQSEFELPNDFSGVVGLYVGGKMVQLKGAEELETITATAPFAVWAVDGVVGVVKNAPTVKTAAKLRYWQMPAKIKKVSDPMPWGGKWNNVLEDYARILLANHDEMTVSQDLQLMQDFENNLLTLAISRNPSAKEPRGWLS